MYTLTDNLRQDWERCLEMYFSGDLRTGIANAWLYAAFEGPSPHAYLSIFRVGPIPLPVPGVDPVRPFAALLQAELRRVGRELLERAGEATGATTVVRSPRARVA